VIATTRRSRPFDLVAVVLLPDRLHLIVQLPVGDADFSGRVSAIKARFTRDYFAAGGSESAQPVARQRQRYRDIWQKRFWEHLVRTERDRIGCIEYVHYNPVKHRLATCPHAWPWSSFNRFVRTGHYPADWCCICHSAPAAIPRDIDGAEVD